MRSVRLVLGMSLVLLLTLIAAGYTEEGNGTATKHSAAKGTPKVGKTKATVAKTRGAKAISKRKFLLSRYAMATYTRNGAENSRAGSLEEQRYDDRAYPMTAIAVEQQQASYTSFLSVARLPGGKRTNWRQVGPIIPRVPAPVTYTGVQTWDSGRVTSLALSPNCREDDCKIFVGAAGGGVWEADNAMDPHPHWRASGSGVASNSIGSIIFDPTDPQEKTLYVGTGEPNGSGDSEAGVGLFKSTDLGRTWRLVPGSTAVAAERSIGAIAVDPRDPTHLFIGTAVARHGLSATYGGRFTPPHAPRVGLYESNDGGTSFHAALILPQDKVVGNSANGTDFFRGGVSKIVLDRTGLDDGQSTRVFASFFSYGLYRSSAADEDGDSSYKLIFATEQPFDSSSNRTEFALAPRPNRKLRIYVGDAGDASALLYRVDNAHVRASTLTHGKTNPGWIRLSNAKPGTPGFSSYDYCFGQCSYDMPIASPPGYPDHLWIGGSMQYGEIFTPNPPSNGRAVQRSVDAGVHFTDMTNDLRNLGMHPDQHAIVFHPQNPDIAFVGSDGGVVRTSGMFADVSSSCASRGISGADLTDCQMWLSAVPTKIYSLNRELATLQFQSLSLNHANPLNDIMGGTQDNGSWSFHSSGGGTWFESVGGDGGSSGVDVGNPNVRMHTYTGSAGDVNFNGTNPLGWDYFGDLLSASGEAFAFYAPLINDPKVGGTWFIGGEHVWRTQDNAGPQVYLQQYCNEFTGAYNPSVTPCGDWEPLGGPTLTSSTFGADKMDVPGADWVAFITRAPGDGGTLWASTRRGRLFVSKDADAPSTSVTFTRIDTDAQPSRFLSAISVDDSNPNHAWVSFSGYNAYTPSTPGHVFEVTFDPQSGTAKWKDLSYNIGDQPVTAIVRDDIDGDLFIATDFGVAMLHEGGNTWVPAAGSLPPVATYGLSIDSKARVLYAATHGRGAWVLDISDKK